MDPIDQKILLLLQEQGRISMAELGRSVALSQPAATERVRRLEDSGAIARYRAEVSPAAVGKPIVAFLLFRAHACDAFAAFCRASPHVAECHRISGEYNYLLKVASASMAALEAFENECDKYGSSTTLIVLSTTVAHKPILPEG
ncbi:Lrp/AsnC family transcriptional regulator [Cohnella nanjingensis]|uniref:Lrp/AsnC family transcriptional regulator n=1 Tax=Cohnella nanjingensis TaxID=1387779 RepID=A0A7X0RU41_9BACL|nr:Lrp/AsnC family transcriptional regulator [Cohnella nanjingensis]MBB6673694.1 Lrp/AsnC family transcriptional regulator [Cohnella nanjingensis]